MVERKSSSFRSLKHGCQYHRGGRSHHRVDHRIDLVFGNRHRWHLNFCIINISRNFVPSKRFLGEIMGIYLRKCGLYRNRTCSGIPNRSHRRIGIQLCGMLACRIATSMKPCQCIDWCQLWWNQIFLWRSFRTSLRGRSFRDLDISCTLGSEGEVCHCLSHFQFGHDRAYHLYRLFVVLNPAQISICYFSNDPVVEPSQNLV